MKWISVKDWLPQIGTHVLVTNGKDICSAEYAEPYADRQKEFISDSVQECSWEVHFKFDGDEITHWVPLPDLPS